MIAAVGAQSLTITVNGTDYSQYLVDFSIGFESWSAGKGLLRKDGNLKLCAIRGGSTLDPRDNADFSPGNIVTVARGKRITFADALPLHPLGGSLLVLAPPSVEAINQAAPISASNMIITIPVGCRLSFLKTNEPDDDESGVEFGVGTPTDEVIASLLYAAGAEPGQVDFGDLAALEIDEIEYPIQKQGGGYLDLAGELFYCTKPGGFLYCNSNNIINGRSLSSLTAGIVGIELGEDDRSYTPQIDGTLPPSEVHAVGVRKRIGRQDTCSISRYEIPDIIQQETEVCKFEGGKYIRIFFLPAIGLSPGVQGTGLARQIYTESNRTIRSTSETREYLARPNGNRYWGMTNKTFNLRVFNGENVWLEYNEEYSTRGKISPELTEETPENSDYEYVLELARVDFTEYRYDADENLKEQVIQEWLCKVTIAPDNFSDPEDDEAYELSMSRDYQSRWKREGPLWTQEVIERKARSIVEQGFIESSRNAGKSSFDMIATPDSVTRISDNGDTIPPKPETWQPLIYEEEDQLESIAEFSSSVINASISTKKNRVVLTVPYAFTEEQLQSLAQLEGEIMWGRAYQYLIECQPSLFQSTTAPLPLVNITGDGTSTRMFLADAIQWYHTRSEAYVGFAGIYLGKF